VRCAGGVLTRRLALALPAALWLAVATGPVAARAHTTSTGLAELRAAGPEVTYRLTLVLGELPEDPARRLGAAVDGDPGNVEWVVSALRQKVSVRVDDEACQSGRALLRGSRLGDSRITLEIMFHCRRAPSRLVIRDDWFDLFGEHYRTLARIEGSAGVREVAFLPDAREARVDLGRTPSVPHAGFFWLGVEHILTGYDHLLFLAALLLGGGGALALLRIATAFTVAHSITLAAAVLGLVTLPSRLVEPAIAASIVWVATENAWLGRARARRWLVSFAFGLVHGLGFASALDSLALPPRNLALALVGFNVGVEAGQAVVIALALPLGLWVRHRSWEPRLLRGLSLVVAVVGVLWFVERLFFL